MKMERLRSSLLEAPVVDMGDYEYFVHPITDGLPEIDPELMREIVIGVVREADLDKVDKIVAPEAMGIHVATAVSLAADLPVVLIRKKSYGFPDEVSVQQVTGYSENELYINNVEEGDNLLLLDDVVSTGGTVKAICNALDSIGAELVDVVVVIRKGETEEEVPVEVKSLVSADVVDGEVVLLD